eukprot:SAG31_NODE_596_length_13674_cov_3.806409_7_plen_72_part_00
MANNTAVYTETDYYYQIYIHAVPVPAVPVPEQYLAVPAAANTHSCVHQLPNAITSLAPHINTTRILLWESL